MRTFLIADQVETIRSLLDATARASTDDELRDAFKVFNLAYGEADMGSLPDPQSEEYQRMVLDLYSAVAQREYEPSATELTAFDSTRIYDTFPFVTRSPATTGAYFHFLGQTLGLFAGLKPGAAILEFGPGWGETTLALARLAFDVTCIDINPAFIDLIRRKAEAMGLENVRGLVADFSSAGDLGRKYDAILFFECFHHSLHHSRLLEDCCASLAPGGRLIFSGEPITADFPIPWGLRLDGQSLWSTASHGWLELGFRQSYFEELLRRNGLLFTRAAMSDFPFFCTYVAQRTRRLSTSTVPFATLAGRVEGGDVVSTGRQGVLLYGPYLPLPRGRYRLRCDWNLRREAADGAGSATLRIWHAVGKALVLYVDIPDGDGWDVAFRLDEDVADLEFVIEVGARTSFRFKHFDLEHDQTPSAD